MSWARLAIVVPYYSRTLRLFGSIHQRMTVKMKIMLQYVAPAAPVASQLSASLKVQYLREASHSCSVVLLKPFISRWLPQVFAFFDTFKKNVQTIMRLDPCPDPWIWLDWSVMKKNTGAFILVRPVVHVGK